MSEAGTGEEVLNGSRRRMAGLHRIFVYGSLLPGLENAGLLWPFARSEPQTGAVIGRLVVAEGYPALVPPRPDAPSVRRVRGLWTLVDRETLRRLDRLEEYFGPEEDNDYERVRVRDADRRDLQGWAYVWPDDRGRPDAGVDWWPDAPPGPRPAD
ncbi:gamma-glutamylcyclotransferase family protein [Cohnella rhizosphaerae]|uniref:Gamma-glutamylcyclotransferase n=1 Tax=Cohnella rhizosphaerae TaxID=1457232 RepID=A0A9X4KPC8_9BACL|nr:gamma-glutamylcyclotransferase family protein [Cohnella rhizosphaerae]MDG0808716.1 gamma-glutamylcyclotransferase [Cohnella rhizosphaerae]